MNTGFSAIMKEIKQGAPGSALTLRGLTPERLVPVHNNRTFNVYSVQDGVAYIELRNRNRGLIGVVMIDEEDLPRVQSLGHWTGMHHDKGGKLYVRNRTHGVFLHRILAAPQANEVVDHINHNTLDNRKSNLRVCNALGNGKNRESANINSKSGVRNVWWCKKARKWRVTVKAGGVKHDFGSFGSIDEARKVAEKARKKIHGEFAS